MGERTVKDAMLNVPVDQAYAQGINEMGEGPSVSAYEWVNALAHMLSSGLGMRGGIGAPGGAPRTTPRPKDMDLRKLVNDYARFVMGKAPVPIKDPDPQIIRQLESLGQRATAAPGMMSGRVNTEYSQGVPVPTNRPLRASTEDMGRYEMGIPDIRSMGSSFSSPMLSLKSEAWPPLGRTYLNQEFQATLDTLRRRGLWP